VEDEEQWNSHTGSQVSESVCVRLWIRCLEWATALTATVLQHFTSFTAAVRVQHLPQVKHSRMQEFVLDPDFSALHEGCS
jgi:hypothetical protein